MKVTVKVFRDNAIKDEIYKGIAMVLWDDDWVRLIPLDSTIQQISYRKDLVFAVIQEEENPGGAQIAQRTQYL